MTESDEVGQTARAAIQRAKFRGDGSVTPDDFLIAALMRVSRFGVASVGGCLIDVDRIAYVPVRGEIPGGPAPIYTERTVALLERAAHLAGRDGSARVELVHLLAAFGYEPGGLAAEILAGQGITPLQWRAALATWPRSVRYSEPAAPGVGADPVSQELFTTEQAAEYLGVHPQTVRSYIRAGKLTAFRIGGERKIRIRREDLLALLEPVSGDDLDAPG